MLRNDEKGRKEAILWCQKNQKAKDFFSKDNSWMIFQDIEEEHFDLIQSCKKHILKSEVGGAANMDLLYSICSNTGYNLIIETGVAWGWSSLAILLALNKKGDGHLCSIDMPYPKINNESIVGSLIHSNLMHRWTLFRESDRKGIQKSINYFKGPDDMIHYDSDKSYSGKHWAYPKLWTSLRSGGCFISDDIQDNIAFKEFCDSIMITPTIISYDNKYLGILIKP